MINGILKTYENNCMSLSCHGEMKIKNNKIVEINSHGMPRTGGRDSWFSFYEHAKKGDMVKQTSLDWVLSYNGHDDIVSVFLEGKE